MARTTVAQVHMAFGRILTAIGGEECTDFRDPNHDREGKFYLDYAPQYGGYMICRYNSNDHHGVSTPFGDRRMSAGEFWDASWMVVRAFDMAKALREEG